MTMTPFLQSPPPACLNKISTNSPEKVAVVNISGLKALKDEDEASFSAFAAIYMAHVSANHCNSGQW